MKSLRDISDSISEIKKSFLDKDESRYRAIYDYATKHYELEVARTRALEAKTTSFLTTTSILLTAYTSIGILHLKAGVNIDLLFQYLLLFSGLMSLSIGIWHWWKAINVKEFQFPNVKNVRANIKENHKTPESVYAQLFENVKTPLLDRRSKNNDFGIIVAKISKSTFISMILLFLCVVSTPISWYATQLDNKKEPPVVRIEFMTNYIEPEETEADDVDTGLESAEPEIPAKAPEDQ